MTRLARRPSAPTSSAPRRGAASIGRVVVIAAGAAMAIVAGVGILQPQPVAGGSRPVPAAAATSDLAATAGSLWDSGSIGGMDWFGLISKCLLVLVMLYITLRFLNRMQSASPKKTGRLQVLESRPLAQKASLHLVAVGDRRLVVGLTPSGMVALAELDAGELEAAAAADAEAAVADGSAPAAQIQPSFGTVFAAVSAPIDAITGRLVGLLGGGRTK